MDQNRVYLVTPRSILGLFEGFLGMGKSKKDRTGWLLIWYIIVCTIWNFQNDVLFSEGTFFVECLVDRVKLLSWKWILVKNSGTQCSFYEWGIHPTFYWNRLSLVGCGLVSRWIWWIGDPFIALSYLSLSGVTFCGADDRCFSLLFVCLLI
jgi:hypothetical protein